METTKIGFIGAGNMANSLIRGLLAQGTDASTIWATDIDTAKLAQLAASSGVNSASLSELVANINVLVLAVKPQVMRQVCLDIARNLHGRKPLIISIAAGITSSHLHQWLGQNFAIVRCMPNTPALVGKGACGMYPNKLVSKQQKKMAEGLMSAVGLSVWVDTEDDIDAVTALSGSGPAYFFLFMEAMQAGAIEMGLSADLAKKLTYQTAIGAAELALSSEDDTAELRRKVTSKGGTTESAIREFEIGELRALVSRALKAAQQRSIELAQEYGNK